MTDSADITKSDRVRRLAAEGLTVAQIAEKVGIRYQHACNVLKRANIARPVRSKKIVPIKPKLEVQTLLQAGFQRACNWRFDDNGLLVLSAALPRETGVYAFAKDGTVMYVGVATMGLAKRLYFYSKPGVTQRTSLRLNEIIRREVQSNVIIDVLIAQPPNLEWNGLPVHGAAGLELGIIKAFALPWNVRSAG